MNADLYPRSGGEAADSCGTAAAAADGGGSSAVTETGDTAPISAASDHGDTIHLQLQHSSDVRG